MCRHCERLVEDAEDKDLMHRFMAVTAEKANRKLREQGYSERVTADDIDVNIELSVTKWKPNPFNSPSGNKLIFKDLAEMHK